MRESEWPSEEKSRIEWWRRLIFRQQSSRVPVTQFCGQMGINTRKFYYWRKRLREQDAVSSGAQITPSGSLESASSLSIGGAACRYQSSAAARLLSWRSNWPTAARFDLKARSMSVCSRLQSARPDNSTAPAGETTDVSSTPYRGACFPLQQANGYEKRINGPTPG